MFNPHCCVAKQIQLQKLGHTFLNKSHRKFTQSVVTGYPVAKEVVFTISIMKGYKTKSVMMPAIEVFVSSPLHCAVWNCYARYFNNDLELRQNSS